MSNLIPITRIYDIYPKYTYSNDVKKFMDEIVDIDRSNVFTEADMVDILDKIRSEIIQVANLEKFHDEKWALGLRYAVNIIDKYKAESEPQKSEV